MIKTAFHRIATDTSYRYTIFSALTMVLFLLLGTIGLYPIWILWIINAYILFKENQHSKARYVFMALIALFLFFLFGGLFFK